MLISAEKITEQATSLTPRHREHSESKVEYIDGAAIIEIPTMPRLGRQGHLPRGRHEKLQHSSHVFSILGNDVQFTKCEFSQRVRS